MEMTERIASIIFPVFVMVGIGYVYARMRGAAARVEMAAASGLAMNLLAPMLVFSALAAEDFNLLDHGMLVVAGVLISIGSGALAWPLARLFGYDARSFVPPMMYNNCGNMGLPLAVFAFGSAGLSAAVALFVACNLVYFSVGIKIMESGDAPCRDVGSSVAPGNLLLNPMMVAIQVGLLFALLPLHLPAALMVAFKTLGDASIPLMLFALGVRMLDANLKSWRIGLAGAIVCPVAGLAVAWLLDSILPLTAIQRAQMYLFASLPPAVLCFVVAERYRQEPDKVASIVLLGNLMALVFVPIGLWLGLR